MKKNMLTLAALAACVSFTACSNEDEISVPQTSSLDKVYVGIETMANTRSGITATAFSGTESIGVFLHGGSGIDDATNGVYNTTSNSNIKDPLNIEYKHDVTGNFWAAASNPIILSDKVGVLYAYYPYAAWTSTTESPNGKVIPVNVPTAQGTGQSDGTKDETGACPDYMWATPVTNVSNATAQVKFTMNHALSMVTFKFKRDTYPGEGKITSISLTNADGKSVIKYGKSTMHIGTGALDKTQATAGAISLTPSTTTTLVDATDAATLPRMLVYPTDANFESTDAVFKIVMDGKTYTMPVPHQLATSSSGYKFEAGKNYVYTFTLTGVGFGGTVDNGGDGNGDGKSDIDVQITAWDEVTFDNAGSIATPDK